MNKNVDASNAIAQELVRIGFPENFFRVERRENELIFTLADFLGEIFIDNFEEFKNRLAFSETQVKIRTRGSDLYYPLVPISTTAMNSNQTDSLILALNGLPVSGNYTDQDLEREALSCGYTTTIIDMATDKGLYATGDVLGFSGILAEEWYKKIRNNNPSSPDFHRYIAAIAENAHSNPNSTLDIWYAAPKFTGEMFERHLRVRLVRYQGKLCRLVKNLELRSLN